MRSSFWTRVASAEILAVCALSLFSIALTSPHHAAPGRAGSMEAEYWPTHGWRTARPEQRGLKGEVLDHLLREIRENAIYKDVHSVLMIKDGFLVLEEYFGRKGPDDIHTLQSVTKSIASTLVGAAIEGGFIKSLDQKIVSFFPEYETIDNLNADKRAMTLRHALTMQTGMAWFGESHLGALNRHAGDRMKMVLNYEMDRAPGEKWYYNSGIAVLLGGLLQNATGMDTRVFADEYLFEPLGIESRDWYSYKGIPHTGGGLGLRPRDMAKIGYLYLRDGVWEGRRILPAWWVEEATRRHVPFAQKRSHYTAAYGYMWWILPFERHNLEATGHQDIYAAYGYMGQFIYVVPEFDMIAVFTGGARQWPGEIEPFDLLYNYVLQAAVRE